MTSPQCLTTQVYPLLIPQGADWPGINYTIVDGDGNPYDLTGCTALGQIRPLPGSAELYYTWSTSPSSGQGLITLDVPNSILNIRVLAVESELWTFTYGVYDILLFNSAAPVGLQVNRAAMGRVEVSLGVTI